MKYALSVNGSFCLDQKALKSYHQAQSGCSFPRGQKHLGFSYHSCQGHADDVVGGGGRVLSKTFLFAKLIYVLYLEIREENRNIKWLPITSPFKAKHSQHF